jgi:hypothetical protein
LRGERISTGPEPQAGFDDETLFWRHERLHRLVVGDYNERKSLFNDARVALEGRFLSADAPDDRASQSCWDEHREIIPDWVADVEKRATAAGRFSLFDRYWKKQDELDKAG